MARQSLMAHTKRKVKTHNIHAMDVFISVKRQSLCLQGVVCHLNGIFINLFESGIGEQRSLILFLFEGNKKSQASGVEIYKDKSAQCVHLKWIAWR